MGNDFLEQKTLDAYVVVNARHQQKNENQPVHIIRVREMEF
jgi:hypothetical protein